LHFVREENPAFVPRRWLLVNRQVDRQLTQRNEHIFRKDELAEFAAAPGLAVGTAAPFVLHRAMQRGSITASKLETSYAGA
jgi:hypothetical protein